MKYFIRIVILLLWLGTAGWLVRYEAFPEYFTHRLEGYKSIISKDVLLVDSWMKISVNNAPVGYSYTKMDVEKSDPVNHFKISNALTFSMNIGGKDEHITIRAGSVLNNIYQLQSFTFSIRSKGYLLHIKGEKVEGEIFEIITSTGNTRQVKKVKIPEDVVIYSPMTEMAMKKLKPGQKLSVLTFDPVTMTKTNLTFTGREKEIITIDGREYETILVHVDVKGATSKIWIDTSTGQPVRQSTPFGWTMEKSTSQQAVNSVKNHGTSGNILANIAVKPEGLTVDPEADRIVLKLSNVDLNDIKFESDRQKILSADSFGTTLLINNGKNIEDLKKTEAKDETISEFLKPSDAVQSDNIKIIEAAKKITSGKMHREEKTEAIFKFVFNTVEKETTISLPSALDVLHTMKGDCNEHTYLFVALARAAGIPSRITTGLVFTQGRFYYHAWPAVLIDGKWREMDPTWGQADVDASHIAMVTGEIDNQFKLLKLMGQLSIEVTEVIYD